MWFCNEQGSCIRDESSTDAVVAMEEVEPAPTAEPEATPVLADPGAPVVKPLRTYAVKFTSGNITIIAECGSNVHFSVSESTQLNPSVDTTTTTVTTTTDAQVL
jgi:hypothetical protein